MIRQALSVTALALLAGLAVFSQQPAPDKAALQQRIGEVKQSLAQNQEQLKQYAWTETVEISLKGEVKKRNQSAASYGPDGKVVKTPIGDPAPAPSGRKRGLKAKIVKNKIDDMKEYMDRVGSLVRRYVPPDPQVMQQSYQAGKATLTPATGTLVFIDYAKPGDKVTLTFNAATKKITSFAVATYLDSPKDVVSVKARFSSLADGPNYLEESILDATGEKIQIKTTNFGHRKASK
jgi:hypothetical protein